MTNETIADIVREMRLHTRCSAADAFYDVTAWTKLCDRIEAAAKREKELSLAICDKCEAGVFRNENELLRATLAAMDMWGEYLTDDKRGVMSFPQWLGWKFEEANNAI